MPAIKRALAEALSRFDIEPHDCRVVLDGSLHAPAEYIHQETIIRGDDTEPVISLASIMAKVTRDRLMKRLSPKYPPTVSTPIKDTGRCYTVVQSPSSVSRTYTARVFVEDWNNVNYGNYCHGVSCHNLFRF